MKKPLINFTVRVPEDWPKMLDAIAAPMERDKSYLTRKALEQAHPELTAGSAPVLGPIGETTSSPYTPKPQANTLDELLLKFSTSQLHEYSVGHGDIQENNFLFTLDQATQAKY